MRSLVLTLVALAGCGGSSDSPVAEDRPEHLAAIKKLEGFADQICACKTAACTKQVNDQLEAYGKELDASIGSDGGAQASTKLRYKLNDVMNRYTQCLRSGMRLAE